MSARCVRGVDSDAPEGDTCKHGERKKRGFHGSHLGLLPCLYLARRELRMRFGPDASHGRFQMPPVIPKPCIPNMSPAGPKRISRESIPKQEGAPIYAGLTHEASAKLAIHKERNVPCQKCNGWAGGADETGCLALRHPRASAARPAPLPDFSLRGRERSLNGQTAKAGRGNDEARLLPSPSRGRWTNAAGGRTGGVARGSARRSCQRRIYQTLPHPVRPLGSPTSPQGGSESAPHLAAMDRIG